MASFFCHTFAVTKQVRLERIVRRQITAQHLIATRAETQRSSCLPKQDGPRPMGMNTRSCDAARRNFPKRQARRR